MIDRGHRELPIRPDYIGKNFPTSTNEHIHVHLKDVDDEDVIFLIEYQSYDIDYLSKLSHCFNNFLIYGY